jgi:hypothetical protein
VYQLALMVARGGGINVTPRCPPITKDTVQWLTQVTRVRARPSTGLQTRHLRNVPRRGGVTCALARLHIPQSTIARVLNHTDSSVTARHYNLYSYDAEKRAALDLWAEALNLIVIAKPNDAVAELAASVETQRGEGVGALPSTSQPLHSQP